MDSGPRQTEFQVGQYTAELLPSTATDDPTWYVVVQALYSRKLVAIDRYATYEEARAAAQQALKRINQEDAIA